MIRRRWVSERERGRETRGKLIEFNFIWMLWFRSQHYISSPFSIPIISLSLSSWLFQIQIIINSFLLLEGIILKWCDLALQNSNLSIQDNCGSHGFHLSFTQKWSEFFFSFSWNFDDTFCFSWPNKIIESNWQNEIYVFFSMKMKCLAMCTFALCT